MSGDYSSGEIVTTRPALVTAIREELISFFHDPHGLSPSLAEYEVAHIIRGIFQRLEDDQDREDIQMHNYVPIT